MRRPCVSRTWDLPSQAASPLAGFSLVEVLIVGLILSGVMLAMTSTATGDARAIQDMARRASYDLRGQVLLGTLEDQLRHAQGRIPVSYTIDDVGGSLGAFPLDTDAGFPHEGLLLVAPGSNKNEWIRYRRRDNVTYPTLLPLERGVQCTHPHGHPAGTQVLWAGLGLVVGVDTAPPSEAFDGVAQEGLRQVYFRGLGTGFSYRTPVDPTGGNNWLNGIDVNWGAELDGNQSMTCRAALAFRPVDQVSEANLGADLNGDGDQQDVFDRGTVVRHIWDESGNLDPDQASLGSSAILQERCNWGGDLDGDGFDDPMFLWNSMSGRLRVRFFMIDAESNPPSVNRIEGVIDLINPSENEI